MALWVALPPVLMVAGVVIGFAGPVLGLSVCVICNPNTTNRASSS